MDAVFKKMNFTNSTSVVIVSAPESFESNIDAMSDLTIFYRDLSAVESADFIVVFCTKQMEVDAIAVEVDAKLVGDGVLWFAYPKGSSKKFKCDFNRDTGWTALSEKGFESVRMVAIDEDWSALRFRRIEFVKKTTRNSNI